MSLGVRFKFYLAICASWQIIPVSNGLKMQVTNLASSPKPLSAGDLSSNSISSSQITNSAKVLPNVQIQSLKALASSNILEPTISVPKSLTTPNLIRHNLLRNFHNFEIIGNPQENVIDAVLFEETPSNIGNLNNENQNRNPFGNGFDLIPSESNIIPFNGFANSLSMNGQNNINELSHNSNFAVSSSGIIQSVNNANFINRPSILPRITNIFGVTSNPKQNSNILDGPTANALPSIGTNNIPSIQRSIKPLSNLNANIAETLNADESFTQFIRDNNIFNDSPKGPIYGGNQNLDITEDNVLKFDKSPVMETDAVNLNNLAFNTKPIIFESFEPNPNTHTVPNNFEKKYQNVFNSVDLKFPTFGPASLNSVQTDIDINVNQINLKGKQNQFERTLFQQPNSLGGQNLDTNYFIPPLRNGLKSKETNLNVSPNITPLYENSINPYLIQNEDKSSIANNNNDNFYNTQILPQIILSSQKDNLVSAHNNNNNVVVGTPSNIPFVEGIKETSRSYPKLSSSHDFSQHLRQNFNSLPENQISEIVTNNNNIPVKTNPFFNRNTNIIPISESPVTLAPRNPFFGLYKSTINQLDNLTTQPDTSDDDEIETSINFQPYHNPNSINVQSSILPQNVGNLNNNPLGSIITNNPLPSLVKPVQKTELQDNIKPSFPRFSPKITSVLNFASPNQNVFGQPSNQGLLSSSNFPLRQTEFLNVPKTELPSVSLAPEFGITNNNFVNSQFNNVVNGPKTTSEEFVGSTPSLNSPPFDAKSEYSLQTQLPYHPSEYGAFQNNVNIPNFNNADKLQRFISQTETRHYNNPEFIYLNPSQQTAPTLGTSTQIVPSNAFINNLETTPNSVQSSIVPVSQSSYPLEVSSVQILQSNMGNIPSNDFFTLPQNQVLFPNYAIPVDVTPSIQVFDNNKPIQTTPELGVTPYISPFNTIYNTLQSVPNYSNSLANNVVSFNPLENPQENSINPFSYSEPPTAYSDNPYPFSTTSQIPNTVSTQSNVIIPYQNPYNLLSLSNNGVSASPISGSLVQNIPPQSDIPLNAQQFVNIPEVTTLFNNMNLQNASPRVAITQELPYVSQNNFNQYIPSDFTSPVSNLPNVDTPLLQQNIPQQSQQIVYSNVVPNTVFPQLSDLFPTAGIVNSINKAGSVVARNALNNLINKKLNAKSPQYATIANLPPVNPYLPNGYNPTPVPTVYDFEIPNIADIPSANLNSVSSPTSYEVFEIPSYYTDDDISDLSATSLFSDISNIPDVPDFDNDYGTEIASFVPYMSSLKINVLPIIEGINLEAVIPNNIFVEAYQNNLSPSYLPNANIPYPVGPQIIDLQNGKQYRNVKDIERLISLFVLSEIINGNENTDWDGLEKIIALLCVS